MRSSMARGKGSQSSWQRKSRVEPWAKWSGKGRETMHSCSAFFAMIDELVYVMLYGAWCKLWLHQSANESIGLSGEHFACLFFQNQCTSGTTASSDAKPQLSGTTASSDYSSFSFFSHVGSS